VSGTGASEPLLRVENLVKHYPVLSGGLRRRQTGSLKAVDGVSFELHAGQAMGLVGESGCGKSTLAQTLMRLTEPTSGRVLYRGEDIFTMKRQQMREFRRRVQIVLQDPFESLNPRKTVRQIISEPWEIHRSVLEPKKREARLGELMEMVGLRPQHVDRYPAQFSGGQRQRIGIARAIALGPEILICDEPVSALDVSIQAQVVNLLQDIQRELGLSLIFIAHDLGVVRHISDMVGVMYLGRLVEFGREDDVFERPAHPYTQALLSASPEADFTGATREPRRLLSGEVPSPVDPPSGCGFRTRCWYARPECATTTPELEGRGEAGHAVACHFADSLGDPHPQADDRAVAVH
jgi:oligopeptide transport system ATP-binding protein